MEEILNHLQEIIKAPEFLINQCTFCPEYIRTALKDTLYFIPILYILYYLIELLERTISKNINIFVKFLKKFGPLQGILFSIIPGCGYSVISSVLYSRKVITKGTFLSFLIVCSDDALPLLFMDLSYAHTVIPVLIIKISVAIVICSIMDIFEKLFNNKKIENINSINTDLNESACCNHTISSQQEVAYWWMHPFTHTFNLFMFTWIFLSIIYWGISSFGSSETLGQFLMINSPLQILFVTAIGLISNCCISVLIALAYIKGLISFPAFIAGLIAITGMGYAKLIKQNRDTNDNNIIIIILTIIAIITGLYVFYNPDIIENILQIIGIG